MYVFFCFLCSGWGRAPFHDIKILPVLCRIFPTNNGGNRIKSKVKKNSAPPLSHWRWNNGLLLLYMVCCYLYASRLGQQPRDNNGQHIIRAMDQRRNDYTRLICLNNRRSVYISMQWCASLSACCCTIFNWRCAGFCNYYPRPGGRSKCIASDILEFFFFFFIILPSLNCCCCASISLVAAATFFADWPRHRSYRRAQWRAKILLS